MIATLRTVLAALFLALLAAGPAGAGERLIILDLSGSMWARLNSGDRRFEVAGAMAADLVRAMTAAPGDVSLGLIAMGHQYPKAQKRCDDIQTLAQPAPLADPGVAERLGQIVAALPKPNGMTPLTAAITEAGLQLKEGGLVILISDFEETCGDARETPCQVFARLRHEGQLDGVDIRFVIAVANANADVSDMATYAQCTGARIVRVESIAEARDVAAAVVDDLNQADQRYGLTVQFRFDPAVELAPAWGVPPLAGTITVDGGGQHRDAAITDARQSFTLPAGSYHVVVTIAGDSVSTDVNVPDPHGNGPGIELQPGTLSLSARGPEGEPVTGDLVWTVTGSDGSALSHEEAATRFVLPPGTYRVDAASPLGGATASFSLGLGQAITEVLSLDAARAGGADASVAVAADALAPTLFDPPPLALLLTGPDGIDRRLAAGSVTRLAAGRYQAAIAWGGTNRPIAPLELAGEADVTVRLGPAPSSLAVSFPNAGSPIRWQITGPGGAVAMLEGPRLVQSLAPGHYEVQASAGGQTRRRALDIGFGERLELSLLPP